MVRGAGDPKIVQGNGGSGLSGFPVPLWTRYGVYLYLSNPVPSVDRVRRTRWEKKEKRTAPIIFSLSVLSKKLRKFGDQDLSVN